MKILHGIGIDEMVKGYLICGLFTNEPEQLRSSGEFYEKENWNMEMFDKVSVEKAVIDCETFYSIIKNSQMLKDWQPLAFFTLEELGRYFWYSRNSHGTGFFDCDQLKNQTPKDLLQELANSFGEVCLEFCGEDENTLCLGSEYVW